MVNCSKCKHWEGGETRAVGYCKRIPVFFTGGEMPADALIVVETDEPTPIATRAEFSCRLGEE